MLERFQQKLDDYLQWIFTSVKYRGTKNIVRNRRTLFTFNKTQMKDESPQAEKWHKIHYGTLWTVSGIPALLVPHLHILDADNELFCYISTHRHADSLLDDMMSKFYLSSY